MGDLYFSSSDSAAGKRLTIAPLSSRKLERCVELPADMSGYFLVEEDACDPFGEVVILAQLHSEEAVVRLATALKLE